MLRCDLEDDAAVRGVGLDDLQGYRVTGLQVLVQLIGILDARMGTRHEALDVVSQIHDDALVLDSRDLSVRLHPGGEPLRDVGPRIILDLLEPQGNPLVLRIHVQDHDLDLFPLLEDLGRMLHPPGPAHVRNVDQAVDAGLDLHEGPEGGEVADGPVQLGARGILHGKGQPGILLDLLHAEGDLLVLGVHLQDYGLDLVPDGNELGGVPDIPGPGHLGDVNQTLDALLQLHEGAVVRDGNDLPFDPGSHGVLLVDLGPGIRQELLEAQRDPFPVPIHVQHLHVQLFADIHHLGGVSHTAPGHVGDVKESVQPAQIDERAEVGDVLDHPLSDLAQKELLDQCRPLLLPLPLQDDPAGDHDVAATLVQLDDLEVVALSKEVLDVRDPAQSDLGPREEGVHAHEIHGDAAFDLPDQHAFHRSVGLVGLLDLLPDPEEVGLLLGENDHTFLVLQALQEDLHLLVGLDLLRVLELVLGNRALALEAKVQNHRGIGDPEDPGLDDLPFLDLSDLILVLGEEGLEVTSGEIELLLPVGIGIDVSGGRWGRRMGIQRRPGETQGRVDLGSTGLHGGRGLFLALLIGIGSLFRRCLAIGSSVLFNLVRGFRIASVFLAFGGIGSFALVGRVSGVLRGLGLGFWGGSCFGGRSLTRVRVLGLGVRVGVEGFVLRGFAHGSHFLPGPFALRDLSSRLRKTGRV